LLPFYDRFAGTLDGKDLSHYDYQHAAHHAHSFMKTKKKEAQPPLRLFSFTQSCKGITPVSS
jgi:hypothetical protein